MTDSSTSHFKPTLQCQCGYFVGEVGFSYDRPPEGETKFDLRGKEYRRRYWRCGLCRHEFSMHDMDLADLYKGNYVIQTYGLHMRATFDRILALPSERSDNSLRVRRVIEMSAAHFSPTFSPRLLDIGSGLGVFPYRMKEVGWECTALDPDPQAVKHLIDVVGVAAIGSDLFDLQPGSLGPFDIITLNKVIEHVEDPVAMLDRARSFLAPGGLIYAEVPDVLASEEGPDREEYFIEHHHVFSEISLLLAFNRAGLVVKMLSRLREPSGKFTLCAWATT